VGLRPTGFLRNPKAHKWADRPNGRMGLAWRPTAQGLKALGPIWPIWPYLSPLRGLRGYFYWALRALRRNTRKCGHSDSDRRSLSEQSSEWAEGQFRPQKWPYWP